MRESATSDPLGVHNEEDSALPCTCPETTRGTRTESPMSSLDIEPFMVESRQFWDQWRQEIWMVGDAGVENYVVRNVLSRLLYRGLVETCPYQKGGWHGYLKTLKKASDVTSIACRLRLPQLVETCSARQRMRVYQQLGTLDAYSENHS
jgi:hypothetical protein